MNARPDPNLPTYVAPTYARSIVLKRKISGPTRSLRGDQFLSRGFSVHETVRVHGVPKAATPAIGARDVSREVSVAS